MSVSLWPPTGRAKLHVPPKSSSSPCFILACGVARLGQKTFFNYTAGSPSQPWLLPSPEAGKCSELWSPWVSDWAGLWPHESLQAYRGWWRGTERPLSCTSYRIATTMTLNQVFHADCFSFSHFSLVPVWLERVVVKSLASCTLRTDVHYHTDLGKKSKTCWYSDLLSRYVSLWFYESYWLSPYTPSCVLELLTFDLCFSLKRRFQKPKLIFCLSYVPWRRVLEDSVFKLMKRSI